MQVKANPEGIGQCGCGRSPNGKCIGWHGLTEQEWIEGKTQLIHNFNAGHGKVVIQDDPTNIDWGDDEVV